MIRTGAILAVGGTAVLALTLAGCSSSSTPALHVAGGNLTASKNHLGAGLTRTLRTGKSDSEIVGGLCTRSGPVTVSSVTPHDPSGGIHLDAWGIENGDSPNGGGVATLKQLGDYRSHTVEQKCNGHAGHDAQIGVQVSRRGTEPGYAEGFDLTYRDSSGSHTVWLGLGVRLRVPK